MRLRFRTSPRAALRVVHSEEYTEAILVCIVQAEELATKIFIANKERAAEQLSLSMRVAMSPADDNGGPDGTAMQSQDLNEVPAAHPQQGHQTGGTVDGTANPEFAAAMSLMARAFQSQTALLEGKASGSHNENLYMKLKNTGALANTATCNVDELKLGKQHEPFIVWINELLLIICNTVGGFYRSWPF